MTTRRRANTEKIHHLWDAIVYARQQKQIPNMERISNYIRRKHPSTLEELEKLIEFAVQDGLVEMKKVVGHKGSKAGIEQDSYRIPEKELEKDGHDWYCFACHRAGEVVFCSTCHRVYHTDCLTPENAKEEKLMCDSCKLVKSKDTVKFKLDDLNLLLGYASLRLKEKVASIPQLLKLAPTEEERWRHNLLIYDEIDLTMMEDKTDNNEYERIEEFQSDAQTLVHNIVIYYGVHSPIADMARQMLRDCCYDLGEIRQCRDCYKMSNEKPSKFWFCQPCDPPHELVFAKQKGFTFWPAKVIAINDGIYDVRFFGGHHQRAKVEKENIKPITTSLQALQLKRSATLNRAMEELRRHQQILDQAGSPEKDKKTKKQTSRSPSANSSRSNSASKSRSRKSSVSSDDESENEVEDGSSSQDECPTSSSPKVPRFKDAPTPEDHNVVSSSCQESSPCAKSTVSTQTHKKLLASLIPKPPKPEEKEPIPCDCEQKYSKMFKEFKERLEAEQKEEKDRSLRELAERLRIDFENEKKCVVASAVEKVEVELGEAKKNSEDQLKTSHQLEMTEILERHRMDMSEVKKKQWCYNCEAEAIYHCCWNTSYCSVDCQQVHWHKEHKRTCRRKR